MKSKFQNFRNPNSKIPPESEEPLSLFERSFRHSSHSPRHDARSIHERRDDDDDEDDEEDSRPVCQRYRKGVCPHGIRGDTLINGRKCNYSHPKRCQKCCHYGTDSTQGCDQGRECELMHPILCRYSLKYKQCTNRQCRYTHLRGTRRYQPKSHDNERYHSQNGYDNSHNSYNHHTTNYQDDSHSYERRRSVNSAGYYSESDVIQNPPTHSPERSFLYQLSEQLKEMQKEIKEVKEKIHKPPPNPHVTWFPTPMPAPQHPGQIRPQAVHQTVPNQIPPQQTFRLQ